MTHWVEDLIVQQAVGGAMPFVTIQRSTDRIVGATRFLGFEFWDWPADSPERRDPDLPDGVEIGGTWLSAPAQRTAVNTEAKYLMLRHAFEMWRVRRVQLLTDARNFRSRNAIERIGGRMDGVVRAHRPATDGLTVRDTAFFSILEREWPGVKGMLEAKLRLE
jgi:RimJ/RimL family protein N-acetyltransferase